MKDIAVGKLGSNDVMDKKTIRENIVKLMGEIDTVKQKLVDLDAAKDDYLASIKKRNQTAQALRNTRV